MISSWGGGPFFRGAENSEYSPRKQKKNENIALPMVLLNRYGSEEFYKVIMFSYKKNYVKIFFIASNYLLREFQTHIYTPSYQLFTHLITERPSQ